MNRLTLVFASLLCGLFANHVFAQPGAGRVESIVAKIEPANAKPGETVTYKVTVKLVPDHYTYPTVQLDPKEAASVNILQPPDSGDLIFVEPVADPPDAKSKPGSDGILTYYTDEVTYELRAVVSPKATAGVKTIALKRVRFTVCNEQNCVPVNVPVSATLTVTDGSVAVDKKYAEIVEKALAVRTTLPKVAPPDPPAKSTDKTAPPVAGALPKAIKVIPSEDYEKTLMTVLDKPTPIADAAGGAEGTGFGSFLLTAAFWGIITLLTPCVFPMVPITVSVFLKQSEKQGTNPVAQAAIYALTIVAVLGISAMSLLEAFRALSVNPWMNVGLGLLFVVFALSLFGMYDITVPSRLVNFTSAREKGGYLGTVFMGLTFSLISFTCVAPFLGGFAGLSASGNYSRWQLWCAALVFAGSFAAPFFVLALFPSLLKKLPKSGGWMNTIKVVMGFLEFAAALKFFRTAELRWLDQPAVFSYDVVLALWIASSMVMGLYLFGLFRLPHDHDAPQHVGVPRMLTGLLAVGFGVYLTPAIFSAGEHRNRPGGITYAWVDAFLLPEPGEANLSGDLKHSLEAAYEKGELVFVDFTGVTCTNCRLNEENVFKKPEVRALLQRYRQVQLYTDTVPANLYETVPDLDKRWTDGDANLKFQRAFFGTDQLPLYVILKPVSGGKATVLGVYAEGKINREDLFVNFLRKPLEK